MPFLVWEFPTRKSEKMDYRLGRKRIGKKSRAFTVLQKASDTLVL